MLLYSFTNSSLCVKKLEKNQIKTYLNPGGKVTMHAVAHTLIGCPPGAQRAHWSTVHSDSVEIKKIKIIDAMTDCSLVTG